MKWTLCVHEVHSSNSMNEKKLCREFYGLAMRNVLKKDTAIS
jgi:hypothetical protein